MGIKTFIYKLFKGKKLEQTNPVYTVREGIASIFYYHIAKDGVLLCGKKEWTMPTEIPLSAWGYVGELHEKYCSDCTRIMKEKQKLVLRVMMKR